MKTADARHFFRLLLCCAVPLLSATAGHAQSNNEFSPRESPNFPDVTTEKKPHFISGEAHVETLLQFDKIWTGPPGTAPHTLFGETDARGNLNFGSFFSIDSLLRFERGNTPADTGIFPDEVLYIQRLFGVIHVPPLSFYGGKIHPRFGIGWYQTPGLYGTDFDSDYELLEKIGAGVRLDIHTFGRHRFTAEAFQADTSFLSHNLISSSPTLNELTTQIGGVSNTGALESFAFALSGQQMPGIDGLSYQIGWAKQKASPVDLRDEYRWSAAIDWLFNITDKVNVEPMAEFVSVTGQGGTFTNVDYLTVAATLRWGDFWALAVHATRRNVRDFGNDLYRIDLLAGVAVAYDLSDWKDKFPWLDGFSAILGFRQTNAFGTSSPTVGFQIKYTLDF